MRDTFLVVLPLWLNNYLKSLQNHPPVAFLTALSTITIEATYRLCSFWNDNPQWLYFANHLNYNQLGLAINSF
jgi:hypothetical protein